MRTSQSADVLQLIEVQEQSIRHMSESMKVSEDPVLLNCLPHDAPFGTRFALPMPPPLEAFVNSHHSRSYDNCKLDHGNRERRAAAGLFLALVHNIRLEGTVVLESST